MASLDPVTARSEFDDLPLLVQKEVGQFNVFRREEFIGPRAKPIPYNRDEYYKISYMVGRGRLTYTDRVVETGPRSLLFANPQLPYQWQSLDDERSGFFCVFSRTFFDRFGPMAEYPIFAPGSKKVFNIEDSDQMGIESIFQRMLREIETDYRYKYDVLRLLVLDLVHHGMKMSRAFDQHEESNGVRRLAVRFTELLERQFPLESPAQRMVLRTPADFANALGVHVNHLNRSLRSAIGHSTSEVIAQRVSLEARLLLQRTTWDVSEVAYALGYQDPSHFIQFFRRRFGKTPGVFRTGNV